MTKKEWEKRFTQCFVDAARRTAQTVLQETAYDFNTDNPEECAEEEMELNREYP